MIISGPPTSIFAHRLCILAELYWSFFYQVDLPIWHHYLTTLFCFIFSPWFCSPKLLSKLVDSLGHEKYEGTYMKNLIFLLQKFT